ncbi:MAG: flagellar biosynthesis protein FliQ [Candidatus Kapabacteria bacterium]|nr:flagellar biosynthesis protein FliQ [Ignavibacteriota bacterium]MCW5886180.1 flagellar biosynthesis protein FliQ [Candidatus Kapabacteria bacterium]
MLTDQFVIQIIRDAFYHVILLVGPLLMVSLIIGLSISIFQAATSISEQTLTFVPKLLSVFIVMILILPFMMSMMKSFTINIMNYIAGM